jgi:hypothetical protein
VAASGHDGRFRRPRRNGGCCRGLPTFAGPSWEEHCAPRAAIGHDPSGWVPMTEAGCAERPTRTGQALRVPVRAATNSSRPGTNCSRRCGESKSNRHRRYLEREEACNPLRVAQPVAEMAHRAACHVCPLPPIRANSSRFGVEEAADQRGPTRLIAARRARGRRSVPPVR